jgi:hypothetical protein
LVENHRTRIRVFASDPLPTSNVKKCHKIRTCHGRPIVLKLHENVARGVPLSILSAAPFVVFSDSAQISDTGEVLVYDPINVGRKRAEGRTRSRRDSTQGGGMSPACGRHAACQVHSTFGRDTLDSQVRGNRLGQRHQVVGIADQSLSRLGVCREPSFWDVDGIGIEIWELGSLGADPTSTDLNPQGAIP